MLATALAESHVSSWRSVRSSIKRYHKLNGIKYIQGFDTSDFSVEYGGEVTDLESAPQSNRPSAQGQDRALRIAFIAATEAIRQA